jgi:hypothetical protein
MGFAQLAQQRCHAVTGGKTLADQVELTSARFDDAVRARDEAPKLLHPGQQGRLEIGLQVLDQFRQGVERAFDRQR